MEILWNHVGLHWIGLHWIGLHWVGLHGIGLHWVAWGCIGLQWIGLHCIELTVVPCHDRLVVPKNSVSCRVSLFRVKESRAHAFGRKSIYGPYGPRSLECSTSTSLALHSQHLLTITLSRPACRTPLSCSGGLQIAYWLLVSWSKRNPDHLFFENKLKYLFWNV